MIEALTPLKTFNEQATSTPEERTAMQNRMKTRVKEANAVLSKVGQGTTSLLICNICSFANVANVFSDCDACSQEMAVSATPHV